MERVDMEIERQAFEKQASRAVLYKGLVPWLLGAGALIVLFRSNGGGIWLDPLVMAVLG